MLVSKNWNYTNMRKWSLFLNGLPACLWKQQAHSWYWIVKYQRKLAFGCYKWKIELNSIYWLLEVIMSPYVSMTWKGLDFYAKWILSLWEFSIQPVLFFYIKRLKFTQTFWEIVDSTWRCPIDSRLSSMDHGCFILSCPLWDG